MHIVVINQYFPPDAAPTGLMLQAVAQCMAKDGHQVTIVCSSGGYALKEGAAEVLSSESGSSGTGVSNGRVNCIRLWATRFGRSRWIGKLVDYASFYLGVAWVLATMSSRPDRIIAMTTPPYLSVMARLFSKLRRADHAHWVMDLYPDAMVAHGMLSPGSFLCRILSSITRWGFGGNRCAGVLLLGPDMARRAKQYLRHGQNTSWVPLWACTAMKAPSNNEVKDLRASRGWSESELVLMYSGNMGLGHLFDEILEVAKNGLGEDTDQNDLQSPEVRFVFYGAGKRRTEIEEAVAVDTALPVELHGYVDAVDLATHLASADVHFVSLRSEWDGVMVPSKLQGIFAASKPVIFIGSEECAIGKWVIDSGGGWVVQPGDVDALRQSISEAMCRETRLRRGDAAYSYALKHFDRNANSSESASMLADLRDGSN